MAELSYLKAIWRSGPRLWGEAVSETAVVTVVSLLPLGGAAIREVMPKDSKIYLSDAFEKAFLSGQLVFYALGLIATIVWQSNKDRDSFFPWRTFMNGMAITGIAFGCIVIGYDPTLTSINRDFIATSSVAMFLLSLALYILMAAFANVQVNLGAEQKKDDTALTDEVKKSRGIPT